MKYDYAKLDYVANNHHQRFKAFVAKHGLTCQECGGLGGEVEPILEYGQGPWLSCGWCEGTGSVTRWGRGAWLRFRKDCKDTKRDRM